MTGSSYGPDAPTRTQTREVHIRDLWAVVVRHWRLVALVTVLVAGGAWFTSRDAIVQYQSTLTLQVSANKTELGRFDDIDINPVALQTDPILSEALVLTTQALARRVALRLHLQLELLDSDVTRGDVFADIVVDSGAPFALP